MKRYRRLLALLFLSILIIWGLLRLGNIEISAETLAQIDWIWLPLLFAIFYSSVFVRGLRWQRILKTMGWSINYVYVQALLTSGLFLSMILPARLGDVGRVAMLKRDHRMPIAQGIASIATERALDIFSILVLAVIGAMWALPGRVPPAVLQLIVGTTMLFVVGLIGLLAVPSFERWLRNPGRLAAFIPLKIWTLYQKGLDFGFSLIHGVRSMGRHPFALLLAVVESLYIWLCDSLLIYFVLVSLGAASSLSVSLFVGMVSDLVVAVPVTPAGLGQFEAVFVGLLTRFGLTTSQASLTVLLLRFVSLWSFIPVGAAVTYIFGFSRALSLSGKDSVEDQATAKTSLPELAEG